MKLSPTQKIYNNLNIVIDQLELSFIDQIKDIIDNVDSILLNPKSYNRMHDQKELQNSFNVYKAIWNSYYGGDAKSVYSYDDLNEVLRFVYLGNYKDDTDKKQSSFYEGNIGIDLTDSAKDELLINVGMFKLMSDITGFTEDEMIACRDFDRSKLPYRQALNSRPDRSCGVSKSDWNKLQQEQAAN